jgi:uncharacterized repeat protein (TIGR03833 family)
MKMSVNNSDNGNIRKNIVVGSEVRIVEKRNQRSGELSDGIVKRILTNSSNHPHGIKVMLTDGKIGRVKEIIDSNPNSS